MLNSFTKDLSPEAQKEFNAIALNGSLGIFGQIVTAISIFFLPEVATSSNFFIVPALGGLATFLGTMFSLYGVIKSKHKPISIGSLIRLLTSVYIMYAVVKETGYLSSPFITTFPLFLAGIMYSFGVKKAKALLAVEVGILFFFYLSRPIAPVPTYSLIIELFGISLTFFIIYLFDKNANQYQNTIIREKERAENLRKIAEDTNANIQSILASTPNLIAIFDHEGIIVSSQAFATQMSHAKGSEDIVQLFPEKARESLSAAIGSILDEDELNFEFNAALLPHQATIDGKLHSVSWSPIVKDEIVVRLQFEAADIDEISKLQERAENDLLILTVYKSSLPKVRTFIKASQIYLDDARTKIEGDIVANKREAYIALHTVKGAARTLGFDNLATTVHHAEDAVNAAQSTQALASVNVALKTMKSIESILASMGAQDSTADTRNIFEALRNKDERRCLMGMLPSLSSLVQSCEGDVKKISADLGKPTPRLVRVGDEIFLAEGTRMALEKLLIHVLRNSLDHGIEGASERTAAGKDEIGSIAFVTQSDSSGFILTISDDGRGLNLKKIRERGVQLGAVSGEVSPDQLAELIFLSGFSTATSLTQVSGRGVGMDAVRDALHNIGGSVEAKVTKLKENGFGEWKLVVRIPHEQALSSVA